LLHCKRPDCRCLNSFFRTWRSKWLVLVLLASVFPAFASAGHPLGPLAPFPASILAMVPAPQAQTTESKGASASTPAIQTAIGGVRSPSLQALAQALGMESDQIGQRAFEDSAIGMEPINGLGGGVSAVAVKWRPANQGLNPQASDVPKVYLLSWDGTAWQASYLTAASDALTLQVLPTSESEAPLFAVIVYRGITAIPYPVIFRFQEHHASLVWDGRADSTSYTGYDYGSIQFERAAGGNVPVMVATGRADPGLLSFPTTQEEPGRGFEVATAYVWKNGAYFPLRTEYTHNRDYVLYRFIAALHLHDYKAAYALIDPAQFLKTKKPSLDLFRERIQNAWPEFTDDKIFEVPAEAVKGLGSYAFVLRLGHGKMNVYHPAFTSSPAYRLTGLARTVTKE
jgi:hypothetical protein